MLPQFFLCPITGSGSSVVKIPCLRTAWTREGHWHRCRLGVYSKDLLGPAVEDSPSLALRTADRADLHKEHDLVMAEADLCEITGFRNVDGPFGSEFSVKKPCPQFVRGCPQLGEPKFCMSAVVCGVACFVAFLLSADVRGGKRA